MGQSTEEKGVGLEEDITLFAWGRSLWFCMLFDSCQSTTKPAPCTHFW